MYILAARSFQAAAGQNTAIPRASHIIFVSAADYDLSDNIQNDVSGCRCRRPMQGMVASIDVSTRSTQLLEWTRFAATKGRGCKLCALGCCHDQFMRGQGVVWEGEKTEGSRCGGGTGACSRVESL